MWTEKTHLLSLAEIVPLKHIPQLCVCRQVAKQHPEVLVGTRVTTVNVDDSNDGDNGDDLSQQCTVTDSFEGQANANKSEKASGGAAPTSDTRNTKTDSNATTGTTKPNPCTKLVSFMLLPPSFLRNITEAKTIEEKVSAQEKLFSTQLNSGTI